MVSSDDFFKPQVRKALQELSRDADAPQLGVHVMSEFLFCPRAGIIAQESKLEDNGSEFEAAPALGGIPRFEIDQMLREYEILSMKLKPLLLVVGGMLTVDLICFLLSAPFGYWMWFVTAFGLLATYGWWQPDAANWWTLRRAIRQARNTPPREPDWNLNSQQEIDWWELIAAGFESIELQRALHHHDIALKGRPWRILHRGDWRLPVLRIRVDEDAGPMTQFRPRTQQAARMAAYAFLIETCERGNADWAIVLFNSGNRGLAFPIGDPEWKAFRDGLPYARSEYRRYSESAQYRPKPADHRRACRRCPFGKPRPVGLRPTVLGGVEILPRMTTDNQNRPYHCTCHDRFSDEVPPHELAQQLGLTD